MHHIPEIITDIIACCFKLHHTVEAMIIVHMGVHSKISYNDNNQNLAFFLYTTWDFYAILANRCYRLALLILVGKSGNQQFKNI